MTDTTNRADLIDSRDIIERIEELLEDENNTREHFASLLNCCDKGDGRRLLRYRLRHASKMGGRCFYALNAEESQELQELKSLAQAGADYSDDWKHGSTLIRSTHFQDYAQELAEDCLNMPESNQWPLYCTNWEWAARELRRDYSEIDHAGVPYLIR